MRAQVLHIHRHPEVGTIRDDQRAASHDERLLDEGDTAGEVVGGTYGRGKRATIRPISGGISCRF